MDFHWGSLKLMVINLRLGSDSHLGLNWATPRPRDLTKPRDLNLEIPRQTAIMRDFRSVTQKHSDSRMPKDSNLDFLRAIRKHSDFPKDSHLPRAKDSRLDLDSDFLRPRDSMKVIRTRRETVMHLDSGSDFHSQMETSSEIPTQKEIVRLKDSKTETQKH